MGIAVRKARKSDVKQIYNLGRKMKEFEVSRKIKFYHKRELYEWISKPKNNILLVAADKGRIVGFLFSKIISFDWVILDNLGVSKRYRNLGIGTLLLDKYYKILKKKRIRYIQTLAEIKNIATRKFYRKKGFKEGKTFIWIEKFLKQ